MDSWKRQREDARSQLVLSALWAAGEDPGCALQIFADTTTCPRPPTRPVALPGAGRPSEARLAFRPKEAHGSWIASSAQALALARVAGGGAAAAIPDCLPPRPDQVPRNSFLDKGRGGPLTQELRVPRRGAASQEPRGKESGREEPGRTTRRPNGRPRPRPAGQPPPPLTQPLPAVRRRRRDRAGKRPRPGDARIPQEVRPNARPPAGLSRLRRPFLSTPAPRLRREAARRAQGGRRGGRRTRGGDKESKTRTLS